MPLDPNRLGNLIYNNLKTLPPELFNDKSGTWEIIAQKIAAAVVTEIVANSLVTVTLTSGQLGVVPGQVGGPVPLIPTILNGNIS